MIEINFHFDSIETPIKCKTTDIFKDIVKEFESKKNINLSDYRFLHNGDQIIDYNVTIGELGTSYDKENNQINVIVAPFEKENEEYKENNENIKKNFNKNYSPKSPTNEELYSIISTLKNEIKEIKELNYTAMKILKEEVKSLRKELLEYKENEYKRKEKLKNEIKDIKVNNSYNADRLQNRRIGNLPGCIVKIQENHKINSDIIFTRGMIIAWFGESNNIPENWAICDGTNGTPDLRNRFIIGVSDEINFRNIGGNSTIQLQKTNLPPLGQANFSCDSHHGSWHHSTNGFIHCISWYSVSTKNGNDDNWGSNLRIDLNAGMNSTPINIMNPYYALFYIMKL